jgi:NAD(P)H-nitrite reductase large subunit
MEEHEDLCLCFHVTRRKVVNYIKIEKPRRASQLSECYGAGTGCGWCRPFLERLFERHRQRPEDPSPGEDDLPTSEEYRQNRAAYIAAGKGKPPAGE